MYEVCVRYGVLRLLSWLRLSVRVMVPAPSLTVTSSMDAVGGDSSNAMLIWAPGKAGSVAPAGLLSVTLNRSNVS